VSLSTEIYNLVKMLQMASGPKAVLVAMSLHASDDGRNVFPSVATLALETCISKESVKRAVKSLLQAGVIEYDDIPVRTAKSKNGPERVVAVGGRNNVSHYRIVLKRVTETPFVYERPGVKEDHTDTLSGAENGVSVTPVEIMGVTETTERVSPCAVVGGVKGGDLTSPSPPPESLGDSLAAREELPGHVFSDPKRYPAAELFERTYWAEMNLAIRLKPDEIKQLGNFVRDLADTGPERVARFKSVLNGFFRDKYARSRMCTVAALCDDNEVRWLKHEQKPRELPPARAAPTVNTAQGRNVGLALGGLSVDEARRIDETYDKMANRDRSLIDLEALENARTKNPTLFAGGGKTLGRGREALIQIERRLLVLKIEQESRRYANEALASTKPLPGVVNGGDYRRESE